MRNAKTPLKGYAVLAALLAAVALSSNTTSRVLAQAGTQGQWRTLTRTVPINPVHVALLRTGQVLIVSGSGNVAAETNFQAATWDPATETFETRTLGWDMFCNGMVTLHDGRVLINGGNLKYDPFWGEPRNAVFDPATGLFTDVQNMLHGRWYPTVTTLGDGRVMTFSGLNETGSTNTAVEFYTVGSGWSQEFPAGWTPPLYPRLHLNTDGRVFYSGSTRNSRFFNPATGAWTSTVATTNHSSSRSYGTSVMLPLTPANNYRPRVMIFGGGNPATATTEIIDLGAATPQWQFGPSMSQARIQMNATLLPNGKVLATGGSVNDEDAVTASRNADLYDPATNTFSPAGVNAFPRLYHSNALLLADATVLLIGGNPQRGNYENRLEIYSPAYLFNGNGTPATRPTITSVTGPVVYGSPFQVQTPNAADIASVVLVRPGTPTHAFDMEQRLIGMSFTAGSGVLNVTAPPNGNIAPPGYYMLFVLNTAGVPSVARFVKLSASAQNQAPVATITSPSDNVFISPGGTVSFAGSGSDPDGTISAYSWTFPGGAPGSSSAAAPGTVTYATAGTYVASLTVTDNAGLVSPAATRTVTVSSSGGSAPTNGLTAYLRFDESSGTTAADSSPANNHGTLVGGPVWNPAGRVNGALTFDGINDYVSLANQALPSSFTLSAWVRVNSGSTEKTIFWLGNRSFFIDANGLGFWNNGSAGSGSFGAVPAASWQHVTFTYGSSVLRAYLNGVQFPTTLTSTIDTGTATTRIGSGDGENFFSGSLDEFRMYNRALSAQEVLAVYNDGGAPPAPDTEPPSTPAGLSATAASSSQINLAWTASTDNVGVTGYKVFRNGSQVGTATTPSFSDTGLAASTAYSYTVSAYDAAGNNSALSAPAGTTTLPAPFDFALANGGNKSVERGSAVTNSVTATLVTGAAQNVVFSTSGLPAGTTASYAPASCSPGCGTTMTITTTGSTPLATSTITVTGTAGSVVRTTTFTLTVTSGTDSTAPTVALGASPANGSTVSGTVTLSATASDNVGVVGVQFLLDGANLGAEDTTSPYSISWNTTTAASGAHALSARARDAAGNTALATPVNVTVDNQPPTGTIAINGGAAATKSRNVTLTLAAADNVGAVSHMRFSNSGTSFGTAEAYATTRAWTLSSGTGTKTVYVQFRDAAGNWSGSFTDTIVYDNSAPSISSVSATNVTSSSATISWTTNEPATSQVDYGPLTPLDSTLVTTHTVQLTGLSPQTTYTYRVRSMDAAGNLRVDKVRSFTTPPAPNVPPQ